MDRLTDGLRERGRINGAVPGNPDLALPARALHGFRPAAVTLGLLVAMGCLQIAAAYSLLGAGLRRVRSAEASLITLVEPVLTSDLAGLPPAVARGVVRAAQQAGADPEDALAHTDSLDHGQAEAVATLREVLAEAGAVADRSVLDAFSILWRRLPSSRRLVDASGPDPEARRNLDAPAVKLEQVEEHDGRGSAGQGQGDLGAAQAKEAHRKNPPRRKMRRMSSSKGISVGARK